MAPSGSNTIADGEQRRERDGDVAMAERDPGAVLGCRARRMRMPTETSARSVPIADGKEPRARQWRRVPAGMPRAVQTI